MLWHAFLKIGDGHWILLLISAQWYITTLSSSDGSCAMLETESESLQVNPLSELQPDLARVSFIS